ncbi:hypothetical protein K438DRAFT_956357 [Mycena galopus ATCC 62051]|nr:hypothetical protein K438DRAFT_956357 [Mycena galopus ATCC 62051]
MNSICVNTDISGIGVRTATYAQNLLSFLPAFWALLDGQVDENELATLETQSTTILLSAFALLFSTIIQAQTQGLDSFHATIVLNLSWMNNTNTFIYMLLLLHRKIWTTPPSEWTARSVARVIFGPKQKSAHLSADAERQSPSAKPISTNSLRTWSEWIPFDHVILIGAAHLSLMGALGIWVWIHPGTFGISASCPAGSVSLFAHNIPIESSALRTFSLLVYGVVLLPYFNLILPVALIFGPYFGYLLHKTEKSADELRNAAAAWGVRTGLLVLFVINVFFMVDTELSIARNEGHQNADGVWTFGQTLALILLLLPLRDAVENILQRSEKRVQRRLSLNAAISNFKLYQDRVPWKKVEEWVTEIESANASVEPHQLWLRRASAQNKIEIVRFLLKHGVDAEDEVYPRRDNGPPKHTENNNPTLSAQNMKKKLVRGLVRKTDKKDQTSPAGVSPDENDIPAFLTEKVFNANDEDVSTKSADQYASEYRHVDIVCLLLKEIVNARGTKNDGCTLLHLAVQKGYAETVRVLVEKGADINVREYDGKAPLHLATEKGLAKIVGLLVENGADINTIASKHPFTSLLKMGS